MKKKIAAIVACVLAVLGAGAFASCGGNGNGENGGSGGAKPSDGAENAEITVHAVDYEAGTTDNIDAWSVENSLNNDACKQSGIVRSPYFTVKICGTDVPVFAEKTSRGVHSFAYADIAGADGEFSLAVEVETHKERKNPVVLPESAGVSATAQGKKVTATIKEFGIYTFTFDRNGSSKDGSDLPLTLMIKPQETLEIPQGYTKTELTAREYTVEETTFTQENTVYYFKKGAYTVEGITLPSNSIAYFEPGCVLSVKALTYENGMPAVANVIQSRHTENVKILGRPAIDFSYRVGAVDVGNNPNGTKKENFTLAFNFEVVKNLEVAGINSINSAGWTVCFTNCEDLIVRDLIVIAYRTYSDGVMLSDCKNASVTGCFVRTGDDAMEVKSTSSGSVKTDNVVFENNAVWTDKGIAYGAVYESNHDVKNVTWRNNSVGYALASWSDHLGVTTVCMEGKNAEVIYENLHFENIEIYVSYCPVTTVILEKGGTVRNIYFKNITAKYVELNEELFRGAIDLQAGYMKGAEKGNVELCKIGSLYFDGVSINGEALTKDNKSTVITHKFAKGFSFDYKYIKVNTQK